MHESDLRASLASLLLVGFHGTTPKDPGAVAVMDQLARGMLSGVILFGYNIESSQQVGELTRALKNAGNGRPILIAVDQEGGRVARFSEEKGFSAFPSAKTLAGCSAAGTAVANSAYDMGVMLKQVGVNLNFAPCIDLDCEQEANQCPVIGKIDRAFSSDAEVVSQCAAQFVDGHHHAGVLTCLKHFPGHGRALTDSHKGLTDITATWSVEELIPYRKLIESGHADMVMLAHLIHRQCSDYPATLSSYWVNMLRQELRFDGVIVTDDMHMGAITLNYGLVESAVLALKAGVDILLFSNNPAAAQGVDFQVYGDLADRLVDGLVAAVKAGELGVEQLLASVERVRRLFIGSVSDKTVTIATPTSTNRAS